MIWVTALVATFAEIGTGYWSRHWYGKWGILLLGLSILLSWRIGKRVHWSLGLFCASILGSAVRVFSWPGVNLDLEPVILIATEKHAAIAAISFLLIILGVGWSSASDLRKLRITLGVVGLMNSLYILFQIFVHPKEPNLWGGFFGNPSMSACLSAVLTPLFPYKWYYSAVPAILAIVASRTSMGAGVLVLVLGTWLIFRRKAWVLAGLGVVVIGGVTYLMQGETLFSSSGRTAIWDLAWNWWSINGSPWAGIGPGVTPVVLPAAQAVSGVSANELFMWLHNDALQLLIEQGWPGLISGSLCFLFACWKIRRNPRMLASIFGYAAMAIGNYPVHLPLSALTGGVLVTSAFQLRKGGSHG